jgi:glycosyltransferase involved in cell wall biosynthesis
MIKVAAYTGGKNVPSARFRVHQHIPELRSHDIWVNEHTAFFGSYPPANKAIRPLWGGATLIQRLPGIMHSYSADLTLLQREILSTYAFLEKYTKHPRLLDVDDAIWLNGQRFAKRIAGWCDGIICGNPYVAEQFQQWNRKIHILPTAVDCRRFKATELGEGASSQIIVWSGTSGGFQYLAAIEDAFRQIFQSMPRARLRVVCDKKIRFAKLPLEKVEYIQWKPEIEVKALQGAAIGIMPLKDSPWAKGKCSYKMLTYMACGLPVVVSPVGMNAEILDQAEVGYPATNLADWIDQILLLLQDSEKAALLGRNGRRLVESKYDLKKIAASLATIIKQYV